MFDGICGYICYIHSLRVSYNFDNCVDCKFIYIFCISEWPRVFNFVIFSLSSFIWGSKTNCNTEVVHTTAALHNVLVKKIM